MTPVAWRRCETVLAFGACLAVLMGACVSCAPLKANVSALQDQALAALPTDPGAVKAQWAVSGDLVQADDDILESKVYSVGSGQRLELRSIAPVTGSYVAEALVRFPSGPGSGSATLQCGVVEKDGPPSPAFSLVAVCSGAQTYKCTVSARPDALATPQGPMEIGVSTRFAAAGISPLWNREYRLEIEDAVSKLPKASELWQRLRIEVRPAAARLYQNGFLMAEYKDVKQADGQVMLTLAGEARVAALEVRKLDSAQWPYVSVPLDALCNAVGPVEPSWLPQPGAEVLVEGIPFVFPPATARADHVDIGESLFRDRMTVGEVTPSETWRGALELDPGRLRLRVPKYAYRRAWVVAASDGEASSTPVLTLRFYRPAKGWPLDSVARVPQFTAHTAPKGARRITAKMRDGTQGSLWLLPLEIDTFWLSSDFREVGALEIELTREVKDWRGFPDPNQYDSFQGGLPSAVRLYALTLEKAPVSVIASADQPGSVYTEQEAPLWRVDLTSQSPEDCTAEVAADVTDAYGTTSTERATATVPATGQLRLEFKCDARKYGLHTVRTTVRCDGHEQSREQAFAKLPPDTRKENGEASRWGLWDWRGGHDTLPGAEENLRLLYILGSRNGSSWPAEDRKKWGMASRVNLALWGVAPFAQQDPYDPAEYAKFSESFGKEIAAGMAPGEYLAIFAEHSVSLRVTHGVPPYGYGEEWFQYTDDEKRSIRIHYLTAQAAFEGVRKYAPGVKCLFGWCGPLFGIPFMREGFPKELFDGFGLDSPQFERMPERPPRGVEMSNQYWMRPEMERLGYGDKELIFVEAPCPSGHRLALGDRVQADSVVRTGVLGFAQGVDKWLHSWALFDCEDYWGSQHYGCGGVIGRRPEYNAKPATMAYATMTQMLDMAKFDGYLPTGSLTAYCVRFKAADRLVYCLWTIRGSRPIALTASPGTDLVMVDENGNETALALADGRCQVTLTPTPVWIVARGGQLSQAQIGRPTYTEAPGPHRIVLDDFESDRWAHKPGAYQRYAENHWDMVPLRKPGPVVAQMVQSPERKNSVWRVTLGEPPLKNAPMVHWYGVYEPRAPISIPGKARALGVWAKGNSGWGRIIYELQDAKGELYLSCGTRDEWNCDDTHSWSNFNFDGWRYTEFPLPASSPGDNYREKDTVWWGSTQEGVVDLPLKLVRIIFEMQSHHIYVNDILPCESRPVEVDDLMAVYDSPEMMTERPVSVQRAAVDAYRFAGGASALPNPIRDLAEKGVGAPTQILKLYPPATAYDGTRVHVSIKPVEGAKEYQVWVSAYADGSGAQVLAKGDATEPLVSGLRPEYPLNIFVTYTDAEGKASKPSPACRIVLKDEFPMK